MITDPLAAASLATSAVRSRDRDGTPTRLLVVSRTYTTDQSDLWDALTNVERIPRWFQVVSGTFEVGGRFQVKDNAQGTIEACVEPESFAVTWENEGSMSWLSVSLTPAEEGTNLEFIQESPVDTEFWNQYGPGATGLGWHLAFLFLGEHLATGREFSPKDEAEFCASADGAVFLGAVAADWAAASIADGDDHELAKAAAQRSLDFYTAVPASDSTG